MPPDRRSDNARPNAVTFPPIYAGDRKMECRSRAQPTRAHGGSSRRAAASPKPASQSTHNGTTRFFRLSNPSKPPFWTNARSEEHTSELQSRLHLVCRLLLEKK